MRRAYGRGLLAALAALVPMGAVSAHVKWFADFSFFDPPRTLGAVLTPLLLALAAASTAAVVAFVLIDRRLAALPLYQRITEWLEERRPYSTLVLRIGMGITLLLSWQDDSLLAPYLPVDPALGWVQFVLALLLIFPRTVPIAGAGIIALWLLGVVSFGVFYMLDYLAFVGIGLWLLLSGVEHEPVKALRIPALYFTVGFSLAWLGMEKLIYPQWGIGILQANPQLTLGFAPDFFLTAASFVEFVLGYLLIIGLLGRPLGLLITLVFFATTLVFGKVEVIGHTHLHAALIVFLLNGPGRFYPAPIDIHRKLNWRVAFAAVNFVLLLAVFLVVYAVGAQGTYQHLMSEVATPDIVAQCQTPAGSGTTQTTPPASVVVEGRAIPCARVLEWADGG